MITVQYPRWGGSFHDRLWCAIDDATGEVWDWNTLRGLERDLQSKGEQYRIAKHHRNGGVSYHDPTIKKEPSDG